MGLRRCGRLCPPAPFAENSHRGIPCPRARCTFPSSWKSAQKSREKPRFLHFLARHIIYRIETFLLHVRGRCFLSQRIKGLSPATAPLPLILCHGRGVCVQRACLSLRRFAPPPSQREAGNGGRCKGSPAHIGFRLLRVLRIELAYVLFPTGKSTKPIGFVRCSRLV